MTASTDTVGGVPMRTKQLVSHVDNTVSFVTVDIQLTLATPANAARPVPLIMEFGFGPRPRPANAPEPPPPPPEGTWQEQLARKGWGYAVLVPTSVQADNGAGLTRGIIGLVNKGQPRKLDDWGALRAWAWGASRALDYFETDRRGRTARHIENVALRQGGAGDDGGRPALRDRLHRVVGRRRQEIPSPALR
jgi:hypothetical protein